MPSSSPTHFHAASRQVEPRTVPQVRTLFSVAACCGIVGGIVEGSALLLFQRINWAQWGRMMHVSLPILWISPLVDLALFSCIAIAVGMLWRMRPSIPAMRILIFLMAFLTAYGWLVTTGRLYRLSRILLGLGVATVVSRWYANNRQRALQLCERVLPFALAVLVLLFGVIEGLPRLEERAATLRLPAATSGSPNIVVIVVDTLRADHLSCYGYPRSTSPTLDRLAGQGTLFENATAPSSWSLPSHASLLTGRSVLDHGMGNVQPMPWSGWGDHGMRGLPTIGEALQARGYRTGAFSANRIYFTDNVGLGRGFMHFEDYFHSWADGLIRTVVGREFSRMYLNRSEKSKVTRALRYLGWDNLLDKDSEGSGDYGGVWGIRKRAGDVNSEALSWIDRDRSHPFFIFLNYLDVHYPYGGPRGYPRPEWNQGTVTDEYDTGIRYEDDYIGRLLAALELRGLGRQTMLVITSDHGESLGDHGLSYHGAALYRELLRVPLIFAYPGHVPAGLRVAGPVANDAIPATILEVIGNAGRQFPGAALSRFWSQRNAEFPAVISQLPQTDTVVPQDRKMQDRIPLSSTGSMQSVTTPRWQLIVHDKWPPQLYDWQRDPGETMNLAGAPEAREVLESLRLQLR
jgi:arylsulfatase A-like enzyme